MYNETIQPPETNGRIFLLGPSLLGAEMSRNQTVVMSKPAYLSDEIVTDKSTLGKFSIPQVLSGSLCS